MIGLNLCPFAKAVHVKQQIHYAVSLASAPADVLSELTDELRALVALDSTVRDTSLLILGSGFGDFLDFNDLVKRANAVVRKLGLVGIVQIAPFHPNFQFADAAAGDIANCTNRSPYPMLHLLREASVDRAVAAYPDADAIFQKNIHTLTALGWDGWASLDVGIQAPTGKMSA